AKSELHGNSRWDSVLSDMVNGDWTKITTSLIGKAAEQGDSLALVILEDAILALAIGLCHCLTLLCPRRFVIGVGVSARGENLLLKPLRQRVSDGAFLPFADCYDIVPAPLGEEVVAHGALALARKRLPV